jgi:F0F1-type ATP synthase membrane subunit b/b'
MVGIKDRQISAGLNELEKFFQEYKNKLESTEQEARQIMELVREKADTIFKENQSKAQKMADEMIQAAKEDSVIRINETGRLIGEVSQKAENILSQFQKQLQSEFSEFIIGINKIKDNPDLRNILAKNEASASNDKKNDGDNFRGQIKLVVLPPYNTVQTKELTELLKQIPGIKIDGTSTMEDNFSISLSIVEAIPLKRILSSISLIESSEFDGAIIKLKLKRYKIGGLPYY